MNAGFPEISVKLAPFVKLIDPAATFSIDTSRKYMSLNTSIRVWLNQITFATMQLLAISTLPENSASLSAWNRSPPIASAPRYPAAPSANPEAFVRVPVIVSPVRLT